MTRTMTMTTALVVALSAACASDQGSVRIELTDAPADDVVAAVVTIDEIHLQGGAAGRVVLRDEPVVIDLLSLSNDIATLVVDHPVPDGSYSQLRFVISGAYLEVANPDGTTSIFATPGYGEAPRIDAMLVTPSWSSSGFKVQMPDDRLVVSGDQQILLVDFDVAASFTHMTGNGDWVATPIVRALAIELSSTLHVDVSVPGGSDEPLVARLMDASGLSEGTVPLDDPDADTVYSADFVYLDPREGPFTLSIETADGDDVVTSPSNPMTVSLGSGTIADVDLVADPASF